MVGQGTTSPTVGTIMERLFQAYLTPPSDQEAQVWLGSNVSDTATTIPLGDFAIPEDEALLRQGSLIEGAQELMRVVAYDATTPSVNVVRNEFGTIAVAHSTPTLFNINPTFSRASVFEAVADNIALLSPKLFTITQEYMVHLGKNVYYLDDELAVDIVSIWREGDDFDFDYNINGEIVTYHPLANGRAVICEAQAQDIWVRFKRRMGRPTAETDTLDSIGVNPRWVNIIMAGAAADLLVGRDIPASQTEWLKSVLEAENIRVGTRMSLAGGLRQYRNMLLDDTAKEIRSDSRKRIRIRDAIGQVQ